MTAARLPLLAAALLVAGGRLAAQEAPTLRVTFPGGEAALSAADIAALPQDTSRARFHDGPEVTFVGPELLAVLRLAGARVDTVRGPALRQYVQVVASDGYRVVFSLGELAPGLGDTRVMLVQAEDGQALDPKYGPWRLWVPGDAHPSRSARQVVALDLVEAPSPH